MNPIHKGYVAILRPHRDTINRLASQYYDKTRNRVSWEKAFEAEPELGPTLLIGEGDRSKQVKRLSDTWMRWNRKTAKPIKIRRSPTYEGTKSAMLDKYRPQLMAMAKAHTTSHGTIAWGKALDANPAIAAALGYNTLGDLGKVRMKSLLTFWYRYRKAPKGAPKTASSTAQPAPGSQLNGPSPQAVRPATCPQCNRLVEALSGAMLATGLSPTQTVGVFARAATLLAHEPSTAQ